MMTANQNTLAELDRDSFSLPPAPTVREIRVENYTDSSGEPSLRVLVVLEEDTDVDNLGGEAVRTLKSAIQQSLQQHGFSDFPYIFLAKPSELDNSDDELDDLDDEE
jgi:hypothetical protein